MRMRPDFPMPPADFIHRIGGPDFKEVGEEFFGYFKHLGGLQPGEKVLEIGCGAGRMAMPLAGYLGETGTYTGIDIVREFIEWNRENITPRAANFTFVWADIYNSFYNPAGSCLDEHYTFPFADSSFDLIILTSVFTHMLEAGFVRYVSEISRMLRPQGRCLATFFLLNPRQSELQLQGKNKFDFSVPHGVCRCFHEILELAVGYPEEYVLETLTAHGLQLRKPVYYGCWSGRDSYVSFQDMLVANKSS